MAKFYDFFMIFKWWFTSIWGWIGLYRRCSCYNNVYTG